MIKMKFINTYITLIAAILLGSCSNNEGHEVVGDSDVPISLTCTLQGQTRAYTSTQSVQIPDGRTVSVWCDEHADKADATNHAGDVPDYVKGWQLTVNSGNLTSANTYYYPKSGNAVDFYALHGHLNNSITEGTTTWGSLMTGLTHTVSTDQHMAGNLEQSDLLYAIKHNVAKTKTAQLLHFKHLMSKIEIYLLCSTGITQADIQDANLKVDVLNTKLVADVTLSKSDQSSCTIAASGPVSATTQNAIAARLQNDNSTTVDVPDPANPGSNMTVNAYAFAEAIIVPQQFDTAYDGSGAGMNLIRVTLGDGSKRITKPATYHFQPGKRYVFYITVNAKDLSIKSEITDWVDGTTSNVVAI